MCLPTARAGSRSTVDIIVETAIYHRLLFAISDLALLDLNRPRPPAPQGGFSIRVDKSLFGARARSAVGELSEDLPGMAREMPARAMRLGPYPRAVRRPVRCALDVYARYGLWWRVRGNASRQIVSDHSVCSLQRQGRRAASAVPVSCLASLDHEHPWRVLRHWLPMRASQHYTNRHHP